jgi:hypothetical protein
MTMRMPSISTNTVTVRSATDLGVDRSIFDGATGAVELVAQQVGLVADPPGAISAAAS